MKVLVTGGAGLLGRPLVRALGVAGYAVRAMSRRERADDATHGVEWVRADISTGEGLGAAVEGVEAVVHAATDVRRAQAVDVEGTRRLVEAARGAGVSHLVYISIVGIDVIPFGYYRRKLAAERIIESSGLPYSILRATQFHSLIDLFLSQAARVPLLLPLPTDIKFQSVDETEVAARLVDCVRAGPRGRRPDFGGPSVHTLGEMAGTWKRARGVGKRVVHLPIPGAVARAFRAGKNTAPGGERGVTSWEEWLARRGRAGGV